MGRIKGGHGEPIIQLDFVTGEYIDEYPNLVALAEDYNIPLSTAYNAISNTGCCIGKLTRYNLLFMKKSSYENMLKGSNL